MFLRSFPAALRVAPVGLGALGLAVLGGCASSARPSAAPVPAAAGAASTGPVALPPVPPVRGALAVTVMHPGDGTLLGVDSTFIFGSVGSGDATLRINGTPVPVADNGAFLAWLPVPPASAPRYELDARHGAHSAAGKHATVGHGCAAGGQRLGAAQRGAAAARR